MAKSNSTITGLDDVIDAAVELAQAIPIISGSNYDDQLSGERRTITIHPSESDGGSDAVFVGLNGYGFQIPRGSPQSVPVEVVDIIKNAKTTLTVAAPGGSVIERIVQRFAFTLE